MDCGSISDGNGENVSNTNRSTEAGQEIQETGTSAFVNQNATPVLMVVEGRVINTCEQKTEQLEEHCSLDSSIFYQSSSKWYSMY